MLRKLTLHGFKSFSRRTNLDLGKGITAIVGPNGCGKSNLADALRWVLGEQNTRLLRSSKLEDVIFGGTRIRKAMGMAEVRLLFDGIKGGKETEIVRRYQRDGGSFYMINGKASRLKDVVETLSGTGLSHTGYVVIGQGMIQELVTANPAERRIWIEEASGVSRARLSEKDMERKLSEAQRDLLRLEDLLKELSSQEQRLHQDKEITSKYKALKEREREIALSLALQKYDQENRRYFLSEKRLSRYQDEMAKLQKDLPAFMSSLKSHKEREAVLASDWAGVEITLKGNMEILLAQERIRDSKRGEITYITREIEARVARKNALTLGIERSRALALELKKEKEVKTADLKTVSCAHEEIEEKRQKSIEAYKELSKKVLLLRKDALTLTEEIGGIRRERDGVWRRLEEVRGNMASLQDWLYVKKNEIKKLFSDIDCCESRVGQNQSALALLKEDIFQLKKNIEVEEKLSKRLISLETEIRQKLAALGARKKVLEEMERSFEGYALGPRTVLENAKEGGLLGILGSVGDLLKTDSRYISALSAALGGAVENVITKDEGAAKTAISFLRQKNAGRCTFLPLTTIRVLPMRQRALGALRNMDGVRPFIEVVQCDDRISKAARYLLGRVVLANHMDSGLEFMKKSDWATRVVTLKGEVIDPGGAMTGGRAPRQEGLFRRKQELRDIVGQEAFLKADLAETSANRRMKQDVLEALRADKDSKEREERELDVAAMRENGILRNLKESLDSCTREFQKRLGESAPLASKESDLQTLLDELSSREQDVAEKIEKQKGDLLSCEESLQTTGDKDAKTLEMLERLSFQKENLQAVLSEISRRLDGQFGEISSQELSLEEEIKEIKSRNDALVRARCEEDKAHSHIKALEISVDELKSKMDHLDLERDGLRKEMAEKASRIQEINREILTTAERIEDAGKDLLRLNESLEEISSSIYREFRLEKPYSPDIKRVKREDVETELTKIEESLTSLGSVNLKAEEQWKQHLERLSLLKAEKEDVEEAIDELGQARSDIQDEMERRFYDTFLKVKGEFEEVFSELFGGGKGTLELLPDGSGIEVSAEPPGRRQKRVDLLSGGERSLCGLALIFAILSVHPSPLIVLDEVDTALDDSNVLRFGRYLRKYSENTQFLVITHQKATMETADVLYGVTMEEPGVSTVYGMRFVQQDSASGGLPN